jgi:hypothetical protein
VYTTALEKWQETEIFFSEFPAHFETTANFTFIQVVHSLLYIFFENGLYYLIVKYYTRPLHSGDAHSLLYMLYTAAL